MAPTSTESEAAVTDDLETSVRSILGEEPSDDVIAAMRDRIAAHVRETTSEPDPTDHEVHEISLRPEAKERPMALRGLVAAVAAAIVLIIGIITLVGTRDDALCLNIALSHGAHTMSMRSTYWIKYNRECPASFPSSDK